MNIFPSSAFGEVEHALLLCLTFLIDLTFSSFFPAAACQRVIPARAGAKRPRSRHLQRLRQARIGPSSGG